MATVPFPGSWVPDTQFSGNSEFVFDASGHIWLVANSTSSGAILFTSADHGATFTQAAAIPNVGGANLSFDPAVTIDQNNVLHIVGQVYAPASLFVDLVKYSYDTVVGVLTGPFSVTANAVVGSDYDIVALSNGHTYVVTSLLSGLAETVKGVELNASGAIVSTDTILSETFGGGSRYGSVSLNSPDGVAVNIFLCSIPKAFQFTDSQVTISLSTRSSPGTVSSATILTQFPARYVADRLTVISNGTASYLVQGYFTQNRASLVGNILLGYQATAGAVWTFHSYMGTPLASLVEPVLSISATGAVLAVLTADYSEFADGAPISLFDFDPVAFSLTPRTDFPYPGAANWLRGTKQVFPSGMPWGIVAQQALEGLARFYTGFSVPPVAEVVPATSTNQRGVAATYDASGSFDLNLHPLTFSWSLNDPTGLAVLTTDGPLATVELPLSAGPAAVTLLLTVSVVDVDADGNPLHAAATAVATIQYPLIPVPTIAAQSPIAAARNSQVTISPAVVTANYTTPTYSWVQTGGTTVGLLSSSSSLNLTLTTSGAAIAGETLIFTLTVSDGINSPVSQAFEVVVAARPATGETTHIARMTRTGKIADRNAAETWSAPATTGTLSGFVKAKRAPVVLVDEDVPSFAAEGSYLFVGPHSVTVERNGETWHALTPNPNETVLDAVHAFLDETLVLTSGQKLLRFIPTDPAFDTDNADTILLNTLGAATYTTLEATPPFAGERVVVLTGQQGVLLLAVDDQFGVAGSLELTATSGLYGAASVEWMRLSDVESLHTGVLLIGTADQNGNTFETEYALATRSVIAVYDSASRKKNLHVTTGEILFASVDAYSGVPLAPILASPVVTPNGITLTWTQSRSDLVTGYQITATANSISSPLRMIASGTILSTTVPLSAFTAGAVNSITMIANSLDGPSAPSNTVTVSL